MAVAFPESPNEGDLYQNPATGAFYEYTDDSWSVKCFENQLSCNPTKTLTNAGEANFGSEGTIHWQILGPNDGTAHAPANSTKLIFSTTDSFNEVDFAGSPPSQVIINGTTFVVSKWLVFSGGNYSNIYLHGDQRTFFEDPANSELNFSFCDGEAYVTLDYFNADQKRQDDAITELEEEFENLLPSLDRGSWRYNEDFTKPPGKFGLRTGGGLPTSFDQVDKIIFHKEDDAGEPHGFGDIKVDSYIQLFQDGENDTAIYHVDALPVANGDEFEIEVSFVRAEGDYPALDELFRFKFYEIVGGDAGAYVLKSGDKMYGALTFAKAEDADPLGFIAPYEDDQGRDTSIILESQGNINIHTKRLVQLLAVNAEDNPDNKVQVNIGQTGSTAYFSATLFKDNQRINVLKSFYQGFEFTTDLKFVTRGSEGFQVEGSPNSEKNFFKTTNNNTVIEWGDDGVYTHVDSFYLAENGTHYFRSSSDGTAPQDCYVRYSGQIQDDNDIVNKKYVDENSGGVEVLAGSPDAPIPVGKMWFDTTKNALYLKTSD